VSEPASVHDAFMRAAARWPGHDFLDVLPETAAAYGIAAGSLSYGDAAVQVEALAEQYQAAGYGRGHRVALLLENRPEFFLHWFALNGLGVSVVPINPDLRAAELEYLLAHSEAVLGGGDRGGGRRGCAARARRRLIGPGDVPAVAPFAGEAPGGPSAEAALLYTSGTTGLPKDAWCRRTGSWNVGGGTCAWGASAPCVRGRNGC